MPASSAFLPPDKVLPASYTLFFPFPKQEDSLPLSQFLPALSSARIRFDQPPRPGKSGEGAFQIQVYQRPSADQHPLRFGKSDGEPDRKSKTPRDNKDGIKYFSLRAIRWYSSSVMIPSMLCLYSALSAAAAFPLLTFTPFHYT